MAATDLSFMSVVQNDLSEQYKDVSNLSSQNRQRNARRDQNSFNKINSVMGRWLGDQMHRVFGETTFAELEAGTVHKSYILKVTEAKDSTEATAVAVRILLENGANSQGDQISNKLLENLFKRVANKQLEGSRRRELMELAKHGPMLKRVGATFIKCMHERVDTEKKQQEAAQKWATKMCPEGELGYTTWSVINSAPADEILQKMEDAAPDAALLIAATEMHKSIYAHAKDESDLTSEEHEGIKEALLTAANKRENEEEKNELVYTINNFMPMIFESSKQYVQSLEQYSGWGSWAASFVTG